MASRIRLDLDTQNPDLQDGLQARIHDPLWMLGRQWQFGEFNGADAGSPAAAQVIIDTAAVTRYQPGPRKGTFPARPYATDSLALETLVEAEPVTDGSRPNWRLAAESGRHLLRMLETARLGPSRAQWLGSTYALAAPTAEQAKQIDAASLSFIRVLAGRTIDGLRFASRVRGLQASNTLNDVFRDPPLDQVPEVDRPKVLGVVTSWLTWLDTLFQQGSAPSAWIPERMEYALSIAGNPAGGEVVLTAPEYLDGRLDWFSFTTSSGNGLGATESRTSLTDAFLPAPVAFRGMPSTRLWEFEDGTVNFASVQAAPQDLARLLLVKFALEYSNDWFLLPFELAVGTLSQIRALVVTNTFGERFLIPHTSEVDGPTSPWRMFSLTNDAQKLFFLPPVLGPLLESQPIEDLSLLRDEMANVAWAVERVVESATGRPLDRHEAYHETLAEQPTSPDAAADGAPLVYRLGTTVPDYWIPLLPVKDGSTLRLKRGVLPAFGEGGIQGLQLPKGRLLEPNRELLLYEEEVPREGARVTRSYQYARWIDGTTHLWIGRRKEPGRGEGSSGLEFDVVEQREERNS
ncbi:MAG: hypothetical protein ABS70_01390 [Nitrospira sp. SCN 59-13]|nr:MAG: hypothetical protein ABS70_01390 [Nitrospira sp. SCN 59-13]